MPLEITAIVLAGGLGTRLRSEVSDRPKVLAPVAGRPFLEHIFAQLEHFGVQNVVLCTGYRAEQIKELYGSAFGKLSLTYSEERALLGTGGAVRFALDHIKTSTVLILNGDSYCDFDFESFAAFHSEKGAGASMLLTHTDDTARYGSVRIDQEGRVSSFVEKGSQEGPGLINAGVYLMSPELIRTLPPGQILSLEKDVFPAWTDGRLYGHVTGASTFIDIGTPQSFHRAQALFERRPA